MPLPSICKICGCELISIPHEKKRKCINNDYIIYTVNDYTIYTSQSNPLEIHYEYFIYDIYTIEIDHRRNTIKGFFPFVRGFGNCKSYNIKEFNDKFGEFNPKSPNPFLRKLKTITTFS